MSPWLPVVREHLQSCRSFEAVLPCGPCWWPANCRGEPCSLCWELLHAAVAVQQEWKPSPVTGMPSWKSAQLGYAFSTQQHCSAAQLLVGHGQLCSNLSVQPLLFAAQLGSEQLAG